MKFSCGIFFLMKYVLKLKEEIIKNDNKVACY